MCSLSFWVHLAVFGKSPTNNGLITTRRSLPKFGRLLRSANWWLRPGNFEWNEKNNKIIVYGWMLNNNDSTLWIYNIYVFYTFTHLATKFPLHITPGDSPVLHPPTTWSLVSSGTFSLFMMMSCTFLIFLTETSELAAGLILYDRDRSACDGLTCPLPIYLKMLA